jgi:hypothetical protein
VGKYLMSAYIAQKNNDRVTILSDAATYDKNLIVRRISSKVEEIGKFNSVMVSRGDLDLCVKLLHGVRAMWQAADHFNVAVAALEQQLNRISGGNQRPLEFILAGVSDSGELMLFAWTNRKVEGMEPHRLHTIESVVQCGFIPEGERLEAWNAKGGIDALGVDMMDLMRIQVSEPLTSDSKAGYIVGGFVERVDVTANGLSRAIAKDWGDQVGKPIYPSSAAPIAA